MGWYDYAKNLATKAAAGASQAYAYGKSAAQAASSAYGKAKDMYAGAKEKIGALPVIGGAASQLISKLEDKAKQEIQDRTGMSVYDIDARAQQLGEMANRM